MPCHGGILGGILAPLLWNVNLYQNLAMYNLAEILHDHTLFFSFFRPEKLDNDTVMSVDCLKNKIPAIIFQKKTFTGTREGRNLVQLMCSPLWREFLLLPFEDKVIEVNCLAVAAQLWLRSSPNLWICVIRKGGNS